MKLPKPSPYDPNPDKSAEDFGAALWLIAAPVCIVGGLLALFFGLFG